MLTVTAQIRLDAITRALTSWCQTRTFYSDRDVFLCWRAEDGEARGWHFFRITAGDQLLKEFKVSPDSLEGDESAQDLLATVWPELKPFEESEQRRKDVAG